MTKKKKIDVYQIVTDRIIAALEKGNVPWHKPWTVRGGENMSLVTKRPYRGVNVWVLSSAMFSSPYWLTFKQCSDLGGLVKQGEKGTPVVYWNVYEKTVKDIDGTDTIEKIPFLRYHTVFNVQQCTGLEKHVPVIDPDTIKEFNPIAECEAIVTGFPEPKVEIKHGYNKAAYRHSNDTVFMPDGEQFDSQEEYYSILFHELVHATGASNRLNRKTLVNHDGFDGKNYSKEELVAELGASYLRSIAGIDGKSKAEDNSASYLAGWLKKLKSDKKLIVNAASLAQKATDYIMGVVYEKPETTETKNSAVATSKVAVAV